jgi:integrase
MRTPTQHTASDGVTSWKVRFRQAGKQTSITFYGRGGKSEATRFAKLLDTVGVERALTYLDGTATASTAPTELTLDEWAGRYLGSLTAVTNGTRETYRRTYQRAWHPALVHLPLRGITREQVAAAVNTYSATRADKSVANAHGLLSAMMATAVSEGHAAKNPCAGIRLPRRTAHETVPKRFLTPDEFHRLLEQIPRHYRPLVATLAASGIRWSEAEALTVGDLNLTAPAPTLRISKAITWDTCLSVRLTGPTKTPKSDRTVTLPAPAADALRPLVTGRASNARLFLGPEGGPLRHHLFYRTWRRACGRAGLEPHPRIHGLRHSHVAWLIAANVPLPVLQARLGHESITTTIDCYGHLLPDLQSLAAQAATVAFPSIEPVAIAG